MSENARQVNARYKENTMGMKESNMIATITPIRHLNLIDHDPYHLCLAHLVKKSEVYRAFFRTQSSSFVIMDNGVVETKVPMPIDELISLGESIEADEIVLPDYIYDSHKTLISSGQALDHAIANGCESWFMAVPQGASPEDWKACLDEMLKWDINCIGLSRFLVPNIFPNRASALMYAPELLMSQKDIHLLGCPIDAKEIREAFNLMPNRIRGTDSGIAAIYAQAGLAISSGIAKPDIELDFEEKNHRIDDTILVDNIKTWKEEIQK